MNELLSVVMCTYNESLNQIKRAVDSILCQSYENFELIIICDNPENKEIIELIKKYSLQDERIVMKINSENIGLAKSLNYGIKLAKASYVLRMDADDFSYKHRLEYSYNFFKKNNLDIFSSNCNYIDEFGNFIRKKSAILTENINIVKILPIGSSIIHPTVMFDKKKITDIGGYRDFNVSQDYDLWLRAINKNFVFGSSNEVLLDYTIRTTGLSGLNKLKQYLTSVYIIKQFKIRKKYGFDKHNYENLEKFYISQGLYSEKTILRFDNAIHHFNQGISAFASKKFFTSIHRILYSVLINSKVRKIFTRQIKYSIIKYFLMKNETTLEK